MSNSGSAAGAAISVLVVLAFLLSTLLIRPILRTFEERENLSVKPVEESRRLLAEAEDDLMAETHASLSRARLKF